MFDQAESSKSKIFLIWLQSHFSVSTSSHITTHHLHIEGLVQGVGFRPLVYRLAREMGLKGWVSNGPDGVHIELNVTPEQLDAFCTNLQAALPDIARITAFQTEQIDFHHFKGFEIRESEASGVRRLLLPSDLDLCETCQKELFDPNNRRFSYPFITCTQCGPRFSIIERLPYDRPLTSMRPFEMCEACAREYNDPLDRRHFSQTNSCSRCGVALWLEDGSGKKIASEQEAIQLAREALGQGKILAVKGIGGYLLMLDARKAEAVQKLRERKQRPSKPFALMYPDRECLQADLRLEAAAGQALQSRVKPIVLLPLQEQPRHLSAEALQAIAPGLDRLGVMLPYTPLFASLLQGMPGPVVATSGNLSGSPISTRTSRPGKASDRSLTSFWSMTGRSSFPRMTLCCS
jgi:hydrogenase maturation protein HypF